MNKQCKSCSNLLTIFRAKSELDEERKSRLDSEESASQLREQLQKAKQEQDKSQESAAKQYEKLQQQFESLQVRTLASSKIQKPLQFTGSISKTDRTVCG